MAFGALARLWRLLVGCRHEQLIAHHDEIEPGGCHGGLVGGGHSIVSRRTFSCSATSDALLAGRERYRLAPSKVSTGSFVASMPDTQRRLTASVGVPSLSVPRE